MSPARIIPTLSTESITSIRNVPAEAESAVFLSAAQVSLAKLLQTKTDHDLANAYICITANKTAHMYLPAHMEEIDLQNRVEEILRSDSISRHIVKTHRAGKESGTLNALLGKAEADRDFDIKKQVPIKTEGLGVSLAFHNIIPDLVIAGKQSGQHRIVIEMKQYSGATAKEPDASQFANYFFHLFATTDREPNDNIVIPRAMILAAPTAWFSSREASLWKYLIHQYGSLAKTYNITLAEIHIEDCWK